MSHESAFIVSVNGTLITMDNMVFVSEQAMSHFNKFFFVESDSEDKSSGLSLVFGKICIKCTKKRTFGN